MPRGRSRKTPKEAKEDTVRKILKALRSERAGKRFGELKKETGYHQSTISERLKDLVSSGLVEYDIRDRLYRIVETGLDDLETRELLRIINSSSRLVLGSRGGGSSYPDDDLIIRTSEAFSFPAVKASILGNLKRVVHRYFLLYLIDDLARKLLIDARALTGERPLSVLVDQMRKVLEDKRQALAFTLDLGEVSELMNTEYLKEMLRIAEREDENPIQSCISPRYHERWRNLASEWKMLEYLKEHGKTSLTVLSESLELDPQEAESILDNLISMDKGPAEMMVYDEEGRLIQTIKLFSGEDKIKIQNGSEIKVKIARREPVLIKSHEEEETFYEHSNPENR